MVQMMGESSFVLAITGLCTETQLRGVTKGLLASLTYCNRPKHTDATWRCGNLENVGQGWMAANFNDSTWPLADTVDLEVHTSHQAMPNQNTPLALLRFEGFLSPLRCWPCR